MPSAGANPQASPLAEALTLCNQLAFRDPPLKENETIHLLEMTYMYLGKRAEIGKLHEHLYKSRMSTPGRTKAVDEAGLREWYNSCMRACDWAGMQKAAMMLQKLFPNNRNYYFWAIAACFIMVVACDDGQRSSVALFAELQLFYEVLSFTKAEDAELVKYLDSSTTGYKSRLGSDNYWEFWWQSMAAKLRLQEFKGVNERCLNVVSTGTVEGEGGVDGADDEKTKKAASLVWKDDWKVWSAYATSGVELGAKDQEDPDFVKTTTVFRGKMEGSASRNALLAAVHFSSLCGQNPNLNGRDGIATLAAACLTFFKKQGGTSSCYDDLRSYVDQLNAEEKNELLGEMAAHCKSKDLDSSELSTKELTNSVREWVTLLKFRFWIEIDNQEQPPKVETVSEFSQECLSVYEVSLKVDIDLLVTDMRIGDELLLLVSKALMCKYAPQRQNTLPLKVAIILLEHLLTQSKHNFTALLLLVRLYSIIGALSCATVEYQRLSIKQIQNDSLSHHVLTRLSTLLPVSIPSAAKLLNHTDMGDVGLHVPANPTDSLEMYDISLKLYKNANRTNPEMISLAFKNSAYGQIKDMVLFEKRVSRSISACQFEIERRRVQRLRGVAAEGTGALWDRALDIEVSDNRSFDLFGEDGWRTGCDMGPRVGILWVKGFVLAEAIMATLVAQSQAAASADGSKASSSSSSAKAEGNTRGKEHVPPSHKLRGILDQNDATEFTPVERDVLEIICLIGNIQLESENPSRSSVTTKSLLTDVKRRFDALRGSLQNSNATGEGASTLDVTAAGVSQLSLDGSEKDPAPWYSLHQVYMLFEVSKYILQLCDFLEKSPSAKALKPQIPKSQISELKAMIGSSSKATLQMAKERSKQVVMVTEADIDSVLTCPELNLYPVAEFLKNSIGREKIESYMDKIARSRSSTWGAVGGVKVG
ncbi:hypothetical protein ABW19_dt0209385 [Dactylella cylindrospora]|nr:hypothetical protein ABW19_dt0209385 [Dactylella cylindrospora]